MGQHRIARVEARTDEVEPVADLPAGVTLPTRDDEDEREAAIKRAASFYMSEPREITMDEAGGFIRLVDESPAAYAAALMAHPRPGLMRTLLDVAAKGMEDADPDIRLRAANVVARVNQVNLALLNRIAPPPAATPAVQVNVATVTRVVIHDDQGREVEF